MDRVVMKKQFYIRPYDPNRVRKAPTEAQERQRARAWHIARLRSLWTLCYVLSPNRRQDVQDLIDADLRDLGAEPHGERHQREREDFEARLREHRASRETDIPF